MGRFVKKWRAAGFLPILRNSGVSQTDTLPHTLLSSVTG
jgi:hypothetical protein